MEEVTETLKNTENPEQKQENSSWEKESPIEDIIITCSKHGLINKAYRYARYFTFKEDPDNKGKFLAYDNSTYWCLACMDEMYQNAIKQNLAGEVSAKIIWKDDALKKLKAESETEPNKS